AGDARFELVRSSERAGRYGNVERALVRVPRDAAYVALAAQGDAWNPERLTRTLAAFGSDTMLVDGGGEQIGSSSGTTGRDQATDLASLIFANTMTGAGIVFRAALLPDVLPFPPRIGEAGADHWIACAALTRGRR